MIAKIIALVTVFAIYSCQAIANGREPDIVEQAKQASQAGNFEKSLAILRPWVKRFPERPDAQFVLAITALNLARSRKATEQEQARSRALYDEAIDALHQMLAYRPNLPRPRLELARAFFERGHCQVPPKDFLEHFLGDDCDASAYHFRKVLAGSPPAPVVAKVQRFLSVIQRRKRISSYFKMTLAPDSNVNNATESRIIRIFGLPFELNDNARASSGIGMIFSASSEYQYPVESPLQSQSSARLRLGASLYRRDYPAARFDDTILSLHAGPRILFPDSEFSILAQAGERRIAGSKYSKEIGLRLNGSWRTSLRTTLGTQISLMQHTHENRTAQDGPRLGLTLHASRRPTPTISLDALAGWQKISAESAGSSYMTRRMGASVGFQTSTPLFDHNIGLTLSHQILLTAYDGSVSNPREDRRSTTRVSVHSPQLRLWNFTPEISFVFEKQTSNRTIQNYIRRRLEITLQQRF